MDAEINSALENAGIFVRNLGVVPGKAAKLQRVG